MNEKNNPTPQKQLLSDKMITFMAEFKDRIDRRYDSSDIADQDIAYGMEIVYDAFMQKFDSNTISEEVK